MSKTKTNYFKVKSNQNFPHEKKKNSAQEKLYFEKIPKQLHKRSKNMPKTFVKMHDFYIVLVYTYKDGAQTLQNFAQLHGRTTVIFRSSGQTDLPSRPKSKKQLSLK